jgi:hypothetical protein
MLPEQLPNVTLSQFSDDEEIRQLGQFRPTHDKQKCLASYWQPTSLQGKAL